MNGLEKYCLGVSTSCAQGELNLSVRLPFKVLQRFSEEGADAGSYFGISPTGLVVEICYAYFSNGVVAYCPAEDDALASYSDVFVQVGRKSEEALFFEKATSSLNRMYLDNHRWEVPVEISGDSRLQYPVGLIYFMLSGN